MNARELIRLIVKDGWFLNRTRGNHRVYKHPLKKGSVVIAGHASKDIPTGTLKDIFIRRDLMTEPNKFAVVYERSTNGFGAYVPDLPGCVAVADTLEETQALITEGIEIYLEELREDGEPIPVPSAFRVEFLDVPQQFAKAS